MGSSPTLRALKIPNAVSVIVLAVFFLNWWVAAPAVDLTQHLLIAGIALFLGFGIYVAGFMGAGDIKLITALMLWAGTRDGFAFLIIMTLIGGIFASLLLITRKSMVVWPSAQSYIPSRRLRMWAHRGIFPYGIAICSAGLLLMPSFFAARYLVFSLAIQ